MENLSNPNNVNIESEKSTGTNESNQSENNSVGEITLEQFQNAIANNLEIKGYYDSVVDKTVNKRLDKSVDAWKEKNLENIINEEINKRYPQKTEQEIQFEEKQKELEQAMEEKNQLQLQIKYQELMAKNNIPMEILDFVAGKDVETTISNIERFKTLTDKYIQDGTQKEIERRMKRSYKPPSSSGLFEGGSMWDK